MKIVDAGNEQGLETEISDNPPSSSPPKASDSISPDSSTIHRTLRRLLRKRVRRFLARAPEAHADANPKVVHDVRVWSRRLEQAISAFFPKPRSGKVRRLRRTPRRIRRALGEWRNCDVLLEIVGRRQRRTRSEARRRAWDFVRDYLLQKRAKEVARAEKKLLRQDLGNYAASAQKLMGRQQDESPESLLQRLCDSVQGAWAEWQSALARARETREVGDLHAFRIATKALRYRMELFYDVGHKEVKAQLRWLADLQEAIGVWHDRQVLHQAVAEAVARADVLLNALPTVRTLLAELETDRRGESQDVEKIFGLATEHPGREQMENWSKTPLTPNPLPLT